MNLLFIQWHFYGAYGSEQSQEEMRLPPLDVEMENKIKEEQQQMQQQQEEAQQQQQQQQQQQNLYIPVKTSSLQQQQQQQELMLQTQRSPALSHTMSLASPTSPISPQMAAWNSASNLNLGTNGGVSPTTPPGQQSLSQPKKPSWLKAVVSAKEIKKLTEAEDKLEKAQNVATEALAQKAQLEMALLQTQVQTQQLQVQLDMLTGNRNTLELEMVEKLAMSEQAAAQAKLQLQKMKQELDEARQERDEAICAATRAMMVPQLEGEEFQVLLSVLPEDQAASLSPPPSRGK